MGEYGSRLGTEYESAVTFEEIQRLFPETIPREIESPAPRLVEGEGEHAIDFFERGARPVALEQAKQDLGVRSIDEIDALIRELHGQSRKVIDLSVEDERVPSGGVDTRLMTAVEIDDCKPVVPECDVLFDVDATLVRPPMGYRGEHATQELRVNGGGASWVAGESDDSAHWIAPRRQSVLRVSRTI
jgi:hypothetical protein